LGPGRFPTQEAAEVAGAEDLLDTIATGKLADLAK